MSAAEVGGGERVESAEIGYICPDCEGEFPAVIDAAHIAHQRQWSRVTFGPSYLRGPQGPLAHIKKEIKEVEDDPTDLEEWVDVLILALDGAWRAGHEPQEIIDAIKAKQAKNERREWPDWHEYDADEAIEHVRHDRQCAAGITNGAARCQCVNLPEQGQRP